MADVVPPLDTANAPPIPAPRPAPGNQLTIPYLRNPQASLSLGRLDSDYHVVDFTLQIAGQDTLSTLTYNQMTALVTVNLGITLDQFIRMWKTILLKRANDVFEMEKRVRNATFIRLSRNLLLPGPLADLCHAIGGFSSPATGEVYHTVPPATPAVAPNWTVVDNDIVQLWNREMARMSPLYTMKEFPPLSQYDARPMMLTRRIAADNLCQVKSNTNDPKPTDALIRFVNDELYDQPGWYTDDNAHIELTRNMHLMDIQAGYVGSYTIQTNS